MNNEWTFFLSFCEIYFALMTSTVDWAFMIKCLPIESVLLCNLHSEEGDVLGRTAGCDVMDLQQNDLPRDLCCVIQWRHVWR